MDAAAFWVAAATAVGTLLIAALNIWLLRRQDLLLADERAHARRAARHRFTEALLAVHVRQLKAKSITKFPEYFESNIAIGNTLADCHEKQALDMKIYVERRTALFLQKAGSDPNLKVAPHFKETRRIARLWNEDPTIRLPRLPKKYDSLPKDPAAKSEASI